MLPKEIKQLIATFKKFKPTDHKYYCDECEDSGFITELRNGLRYVTARCNCKLKTESERNLERLTNVFGVHNVHTLSKEQSGVVDILKASGKTSIWLYGESGNGKSSLFYNTLKSSQDKFFCIKGKNIEKLFREQDHTGTYIKKQFNYIYDIVAIDDLDKHWPFSEAIKRDIYDFLDELSEKRCKVLINANMGIEKFTSAWPEHMKDPLIRRLKKKCLEVKL